MDADIVHNIWFQKFNPHQCFRETHSSMTAGIQLLSNEHGLVRQWSSGAKINCIETGAIAANQ